MGISKRTLERWAHSTEDRRRGPAHAPENKLSPEEEAAVLRLVNAPEYRNLSPEQVVAKAADNGVYLASERTIRRILKRHRMATYRERTRAASPHSKPTQYLANAPLQVLTWDITYLRHCLVKGAHFYLYMFIDIWSRRIVGAEVHEVQSADLAAALLSKVCDEHELHARSPVVHADNGAPMKGATMLATMQALGIVRSFSRPGVSDDNPYIESIFRHLKYAPSYPAKGFASLAEARAWVDRFVRWYNEEHLHSSIAFVTPSQRHAGDDIALLANRRTLYQAAKAARPSRWTRHCRQWHRPAIVLLNPDRVVETARHDTATAA